MESASILLAFLAIMAPCAVVYVGLITIRALARHRAEKVKAAQDKEMREYDEIRARMKSMRQSAEAAGGRSGAPSTRKSPVLHAVPRTQQAVPRAERAPSSSTLDDPFPFFAVTTSVHSEPPASSYAGGGGAFDGGGASGDWKSTPSEPCSSSDSSSSSDSGNCSPGD